MENQVLANQEILKDFMAFLRRECLDDVTRENIRLNQSLDIPLMKYFAHIPAKELFKLSRENMERFLTDFEEGKAYETAARNLKLWEKNELPGISKEMIEPGDLVFISVSQKKAIFSFIPRFTSDILTGLKIIQALEEFYMITQEAGFQIYNKLREEAAQEAVRLKAEHEETLQKHVFKLEILNKELEAFTYSVSHDLRAPLRHIDGYIDLLRKNTEFDEKNGRYLNIISESAKRMGSLIDELLAFSRLGSMEIRKTKIDLNELVQEVIKNMENEAGERKITWKTGSLPDMEGDRNLIRQVYVNLISNAIKYTSGVKQARIEIGALSGENGPVYFIRDNGAGFNMKYIDKLFGIFQRLHKSSEFDGIGIGLANVKRIIEKHNGRVWAEGKVNEGATFYFEFNNKPETV